MFQSLRSRLIVLLSLAVLPLGLIAVQQTVHVVSDAARLEEQDILFRTLQAASAEQELLREAIGTASALGAVAVEVGPATPACDRVMARLVEGSGAYVFAGFVGPDGRLTCSFDGSRIDVSTTPTWIALLENQRQTISISDSGAVSGQSVIIVSVPVFDAVNDSFLGAASVSVPHSIADRLMSVRIEGLSLALIDANGKVLTSSDGIANDLMTSDLGIVPRLMEVGAEGATVVVRSDTGEEHLAALAPLFAQDVYVLGIWDKATVSYGGLSWGSIAPLFPILMWIAAMAVAILALERLVLRHLRALRRRMTAFSTTSPTDLFVTLDSAPAEFEEITASYNAMVDRILTDRAELSRNLAEKDLLIREVHHRVKNNLQLVASMLNIQIRNLKSPREKDLLRRVQDRVLSLAVVHRALYEDKPVGLVRADRLLRTVLEATFRGGLPERSEVKTRIDTGEVVLDADQAVPLALLAAEAATNAIKFAGRPDGLAAEIVVKLFAVPEGDVVLTISNTIGAPLLEGSETDLGGLGMRLIDGFIAQLGGRMETTVTDTHHRMTLRFLPLLEARVAESDSAGLSFYGSGNRDLLKGGRKSG